MPHDSRSRSRIVLWANRLNRLPRSTRIIVVAVITMELVALAWLVVSRITGVNALDADPQVTTQIVIVCVLGLVFYGVGWWAMVGFDLDPDRPWYAGTPAVWFAAAGAAGLIVIVMLALFGLALGYVL
ncbi:MAG: hypothetical protein JW966_09720 [Anaerolineae bacterium]|nr:hypothetical protein [Anaerolineae bacterium]